MLSGDIVCMQTVSLNLFVHDHVVIMFYIFAC